MTSVDQLERDLSAWFVETAGRGTPEFVDEILLETSRVRQRPRWTFLPLLRRPMDRTPVVGMTGFAQGSRLAIIVLALGLLLLAAGAAWVASQPRLPAPFGPAANGLVAYVKGGDIFLVDPLTGERTGLVVGPEVDNHPRWSPDGTRLAFVRETSSGQRIIIVDAAGAVQTVSDGDGLQDVDPDGIAWSPDGRTVLVRANPGAVYLIDTTTGQPTLLPIAPWGLEVQWRPPDGRELIFAGGLEQQPALYRYSLADGAITVVPGTERAPAGAVRLVRPIGWTADGTRFAYHRSAPTETGFETAVVDVQTGDEIVLDLAFGRISNDGTRIVGFAADRDREWICVAPVDGGPCSRITGPIELVDWSGWASFQWAPDDRWIWSRPSEDGAALLLDPNGGGAQWPPWAAEGANSWQRRAP